MNICIDFTRIISKEKDIYHGGGYHTYRIVKEIINRMSINDELIIFWPIGYSPKIEDDKELFQCNKIKNKYTENIWNENFDFFNKIFFPLIDPWNFHKLKKIKNRYPNLYTLVYLPDLRLLDILEYDSYNQFYFRYGKIEFILHYMNRVRKSIKYKRGLQLVNESTDYLLTCSNFSMQQILKYANPKNINYFYDVLDSKCTTFQEREGRSYILFVSGNREEKNFVRTVEAYLNVIETIDVDVDLYVTGNEKLIREIVKRNKKINWKEFEKHVKLLGYVSEYRMQELYANCEFLLYTSKSEGFGLPALNAGIYGRPVIASSRTAIPEVLGSTAIYVNPYEISSIERGIREIMDIKNKEFYEQRAKEYITVLQKQIGLGLSRTVELILQEVNT